MEEEQNDFPIKKLAEELITVMDNEKMDKTYQDNIMLQWHKILEIREQQKSQTKDIIQRIIEIESVEESDCKKMESGYEQINQEGQTLEQFLFQKKEELASVKTVCDELQQKLELSRQEVQRLNMEKQEKERQRKISIPKTRHDISLYKLITNLHWELNTPPNEIRGYVCGSSEVKPFSLNKGQMSNFDIVNALWDIIGDGTEDW